MEIAIYMPRSRKIFVNSFSPFPQGISMHAFTTLIAAADDILPKTSLLFQWRFFNKNLGAGVLNLPSILEVVEYLPSTIHVFLIREHRARKFRQKSSFIIK